MGFDGFYPGDVAGVDVVIWADSGEISAIHEIVTDNIFGSSNVTTTSSIPSSVENSAQLTNQMSSMLVVLAIVGGSAATSVTIFKTKIVNKKTIGKKQLALLFCILMLLSVLPMTSSTVDGAYAYGKSRVYSMEYTPTGYYNDTADGAELTAAAEVSNYVGNRTQTNGYSTTNWHGSSTTVNNIVDYLSSDEQTYGQTTVYYSGHFSVRGCAFQTYGGYPVYDYQIYPNTAAGKHFFIFLWVCTQAENEEVAGTVRNYSSNSVGMPIAWTHRDDTTGHPYMSADGYANPDYNGQCYISFYGFSPMLSGIPVSTFYGVSGVSNCKEFIKNFYDYAIIDDLSVHDALDQASQDYFGCYYSSSVLYTATGYDSYWPGGANDEPYDQAGYYPRDYDQNAPKNSMKVYGDSSIHLYQPNITLSGNSGLSPTFTIDGNNYGTGTYRVTPNSHSISVGDISGYVFDHFIYHDSSGDTYYYYRPVSLTVSDDATMTAYYNQGPYTITVVDAGDEGYLPSGMQLYPRYYGNTFQLTAQPNQYHTFQYWQCTSGSIGISGIYDNPATFTVQGDATVRAVFADKTQIYITCTEAAHSDIYPDSGWYSTGTSQQFNYAAATGYEITAVEVDGNPVTISDHYTFSAGDMWQNHELEIFTAPMATTSFSATHLYYGGSLNMPVYINGDGGHQMPYSQDLSTLTTHDFEFEEAYGYVWVDTILFHHDGSNYYYYDTPYVSDVYLVDNDYFTVYYDTWGYFMMVMDGLGYDEEYIQGLVDLGISPQTLKSYVAADLDLYAIGALLGMGFEPESFTPLLAAETWSR